MLEIENDWLAYQLDLCAALAGSRKPGPKPMKGKPVGTRKMQIPESGVW